MVRVWIEYNGRYSLTLYPFTPTIPPSSVAEISDEEWAAWQAHEAADRRWHERIQQLDNETFAQLMDEF